MQEVLAAGKFPHCSHVPPERRGYPRSFYDVASMMSPVYSLPMKRTGLLTLLAGIVAIGVGTLAARPETATGPTQSWWIGFLVLTPLCLAILIWRGYWWAAMACVMYGTIGLALDLATTIQTLTKDPITGPSVLNNLISGCLNFLLILFGGRSFLDVTQAPPQQESRPPNPPSPS